MDEDQHNLEREDQFLRVQSHWASWPSYFLEIKYVGRTLSYKRPLTLGWVISFRSNLVDQFRVSVLLLQFLLENARDIQ